MLLASALNVAVAAPLLCELVKNLLYYTICTYSWRLLGRSALKLGRANILIVVLVGTVEHVAKFERKMSLARQVE